MSAVLEALLRRAHTTPNDTLVSWSGGALTAAELLAEVERLAQALCGDSSPVGVLLDNGPAWVVADLALIAADRPHVPIPPFFTPTQRDHALADAGAGLLVTPGGPADQVCVQSHLRLTRTDLAPRPAPRHGQDHLYLRLDRSTQGRVSFAGSDGGGRHFPGGRAGP